MRSAAGTLSLAPRQGHRRFSGRHLTFKGVWLAPVGPMGILAGVRKVQIGSAAVDAFLEGALVCTPWACAPKFGGHL